MPNYKTVTFRTDPADRIPKGRDCCEVAIGFTHATAVTPALMRDILRRLFEDGRHLGDARPLLCLTERPKDGRPHAYEGVRTSSWHTATSTAAAGAKEGLGTVMRDGARDRYFTHVVGDVTDLMVTYDADAPPDVITDVRRRS